MTTKAMFVVGLCASIAATCHAVTHVDVLVAYDTTATQWINDASFDQRTFAEGQIAKANEVLRNSGLGSDFDFRLVGVHSGAFAYQGMNTTLDAAINSSDSAWAALRSDRDKNGADIVVVLVNTGMSSGQMGNSTGMKPMVNGERKYGLDFQQAAEWLEWFAPRTYGIVDISAANDGYTFIHEIGHMMGAGHSEILSPSYSEPGPQLYSYSAAVMMQGSDSQYYSTVMGYNSTGYSGSPTYIVLPCFSSPTVVNPATGEPLGDASHDNVSTLRNTYAKVAAFSPEASSYSSDASTTPGEFTAKKTVINAAVKSVDYVRGIAEFTVAATKKGESKVSGSIIGLDGKKKMIKSTKCKVYKNGSGVACVTLDGIVVNGIEGTLTATLGSDGSVSNGSIGSLTLVSATKGIDSGVAKFYTSDIPQSVMGGEVVKSVTQESKEYSVLPTAATPENVEIGTKWVVAKGGRIKLARNRDTGASELVLNGTGNFSALKLNYKAKTGAFKGSFTVYALDGGKLKKYRFNVTGVAVGGKGVGIAASKNADLTLDVVVE